MTPATAYLIDQLLAVVAWGFTYAVAACIVAFLSGVAAKILWRLFIIGWHGKDINK